MTPENENPAATLRRLANGYQVSQAIHVAAVLGLAEELAGEARSAEELAEATGANPGALFRLLRALATVGVLADEDGRFSLTAVGQGLRSDAEEPLGGWAAYVGRPYYWQAWSSLADSVRTGENAFRLLHGVDVWEYRSQRPEESAIFDRAMTDLTRRVNRAVLDAYDFGRHRTVVDVGGGHGALLAAVLSRHPEAEGVLFDQPHVVAHAAEGPLADERVASRCRIVAGSFFEGVPAGGDAYVLKAIVHDWEDPEAVAILRRCRESVAPSGVLLLIERVFGTGDDRETAFSDLNMLVSPGGRERTHEEYAALLEDGGFRLRTVTPTRAGVAVVEADPA